MDQEKERILNILKKNTIIDPITDCYLYVGYVTKYGYGEIHLTPKRKERTHRLSAWIFLDYDLESNLQINHKTICSNSNCWNFNHIYIGNQLENMQDAIIIGTHINVKNSGKTHCKNGHEFTEENTSINKKGCKICRICHNQHCRNSYLPNKTKRGITK